MKKFYIFTALSLCLFLMSNYLKAQEVLSIGETKYYFKGPFPLPSVKYSKLSKSDKVTIKIGRSEPKLERIKKETVSCYYGFGFACPTGQKDLLPIYYGNSFNLTLGIRYLYRVNKFYAIGTFLQYSGYSYKLNYQGKDIFDMGVATLNGRHFFRTDNIGTGIENKFYLFPHKKRRMAFIELGAYGDYTYSKRLKIKDFSSGHKEKFKYRDGSKFNPFQAGISFAIGYGSTKIKATYRLTNLLRMPGVDDPTRLNIGIIFE